jgi:hypothetical protein
VFGPTGLAGAVSFSWIYVVVGISLLSTRILAPHFPLRPLLAVIGRAAAAALGGGAAGWAVLLFWPPATGPLGFARLGAGGLTLSVIYVLLCWLFGVRAGDVGLVRRPHSG